MNGYEYDVIVLIGNFHNLVYSSPVIAHSHETSEYSYTVINMYHVIAHIERIQVIESQLLTLFHRPSYRDSVEAVEYLVVGIDADLVVVINETVVQGFSAYEFRQYASALGND